MDAAAELATEQQSRAIRISFWKTSALLKAALSDEKSENLVQGFGIMTFLYSSQISLTFDKELTDRFGYANATAFRLDRIVAERDLKMLM